MKHRAHPRNPKGGFKWSYLIALYVTLLVLSQTIRVVFPRQPLTVGNRKVVPLQAPAGHDPIGSKIRPAYFDQDRTTRPGRPVVRLLHGHPPTAEAARREMITDLAPERIRSLALISAVGVQEFELLGDHASNRAFYGFQLALARLVHNALPHMGLLDPLPFNPAYARTFFETDLRPLRSYLGQYTQPMLIVHGRQNARVPAAAARELHRIVPQSELVLLDGDHRIISEHPARVTAEVSDFIRRVESGRASNRSQADSARILAAQKHMNQVSVPPAEGAALAIIMVVIILASLISEDLTCIGAGLPAARGVIGFVPALCASFAGILFGDILLFLAGRYLGRLLKLLFQNGR